MSLSHGQLAGRGQQAAGSRPMDDLLVPFETVGASRQGLVALGASTQKRLDEAAHHEMLWTKSQPNGRVLGIVLMNGVTSGLLGMLWLSLFNKMSGGPD
ncbi:hypothetical protein VTI74DRAFT_7762 [Chaetomium olivicolor]